MSDPIPYGCPEPGCRHATLAARGATLACPNGHVFPFVPGTAIPLFAGQDENVNEYTVADAAQMHDNAFRWLFDSFGSDEVSLRESLVARLKLRPGQKVLVTGVGAGNDLPFIAAGLQGKGTIYGQDIAKEMLVAGVERLKGDRRMRETEVHYSVSDATNLPFADDLFDAAYHFGGINLFPDIGKGISEMNRVVKPGGRVVFGDEGLPPWLKNTEYGRLIINNNYLCGFDAPLALIPETAREVRLSWEMGFYFWVIDYTVSNTPLSLDIDVPHVGRRGGSMRTRYYGQLEGVDPQLKERLYAEAQKRGVSRVALLESLLEKGLAGEGR